MVHTRGHMGTEVLEKEVKVRVPKEIKRALSKLADERHLDLSDIAREAFRDFLAKNQPEKRAA